MASITFLQAGSGHSPAATISLSPPPGPDLNAGLVAYYRMNGDGQDATAGAAHGTITGAVAATDRFNNPNQALSFDGIDDIMQAPDALLPKGNANRTVCCFYKVKKFPPADSNEQALVSYGLPQVGRSFFLTHEYTSRKLAWSPWGSALVWDEDPLSPGVWRFAAVTLSGTTASLYTDGLRRSQGTFAVDTGSTGKVSFGRMEGSPGSTRRLNGSLDDVRIYSRSVPAEEMLLIHDMMTRDTDLDGSNDFDEMVIFGTNHESVDSDGDGFKDGIEVLYKSNPADPASKPNYVAAYPAVEVEFVTALGKQYQLQNSADLATWIDVDSPIDGTGGLITKFLATRGADKKFWRWVEVP